MARDEQFHHMLKRIDRIPNGPVLNFAKVVHRVISVGDAAPRPSAITVASSQPACKPGERVQGSRTLAPAAGRCQEARKENAHQRAPQHARNPCKMA